MSTSGPWFSVFFGMVFLPALAAEGDDRDFKPSADKVKLVVGDDVRQKAESDANWKAVVEWLENKENWEKMFKRQDDQLGIYRKDGLPITVTLQSKDTSPTIASASPGHKVGTMTVSVSALIKFVRAMKVEVPRATEMFVTHELTHCLQQGAGGELISLKWPLWLIEGMGCYAGDDTIQDRYFKLIKKQGIRDLDAVKGNETYPRGRLFFKYLHKTYGEEKLKAYVSMLYQKVNYKEALEKVTEKKWEDFKAEELKWAREYAREFM